MRDDTYSCPRMLEYRPPRIGMGLLLVALLAHVATAARLTPSPDLFYAGLTVIGSGLAVMMRAWWLFKKAQLAICPTHFTREILVNDIFAVTRNPMYLGMVLMFVGTGIALASWAILSAAAIFAVILDTTFCRYEEQKLAEQFGRLYSDYKARVRRWI